MGKGVEGFSGERLKEAREARSLTVTALADLIGVSRQSVSSYENEKKSPSIEIVELISSKLNLPKTFFFSIRHTINNKPLFFRSLSAATKSARIRAARRFVWLQDIAEYLRNFFYFPETNLPGFELPNKLETLSSEEIEKIAEGTRTFWKLGEGPLSKVIPLLENNGIVLGMGYLDSTSLDAFSQGAEENSPPFIFLSSDKQVAVRTRFDVCHELGHLVIHGNINKIGNASRLKILESQAFRFAGSFLLPASSFSYELPSPTLDNFLVLKERWGCSVAMMIKRCEDLEIISQERATTLWKRYTWRKWRQNEPLDDELISEQPVFLRACIESLVDNNIKTKEDIISDLSLTPKDIEEIACLPSGFFANNINRIEPKLRETNTEKKEGKIIQFPKN